MAKADPKTAPAVRRELAAIAKRQPAVAESMLAGAALELARQLDSPKNSATSKSMCARALIEVRDKLYELAPPEPKADAVDKLVTRHSKRRSARRRAKSKD